MPWCDQCNKFWNPPSLTKEGACPTCGQDLTPATPAKTKTAEDVKVPWHFKLLLVAIVIYLLFRAWQGVVWLGHHL